MTVWDRQAETCCQYLKKGSSLHVEGSLKMDSWEDKTTGEKRSKIKVHADRAQFLDRREPAGMAPDDEFSPPSTREAPARRPTPTSEPRGGSAGTGNGSPRNLGAPTGGSAPRRPLPEPEPAGDDDEDIPF